MSDWVLVSIGLSVGLTLLLNLLPRLMPNASRKVIEKVHRRIEEDQAEGTPRVRVFFPWKAMLLVSVVLTVLLNVFGAMSR